MHPRPAHPDLTGAAVCLDDLDAEAGMALLVELGFVAPPVEPTAERAAEPVEVDALDARGVLALVEETVDRRRGAEVDDLLLAAHWADLHASDPRDDPAPDGHWRAPGGERLVRVGGEGTPEVRDLCLVELAVARRVHHLAARRLVADVLDLRHRLPRLWAATLDLRCEAWLSRRVASLSRVLPAAVCHVVDEAVTAALDHSPAKVLALAEAKVVEADPAGHAERTAAERERRYVALTRVDEAGMREVIARLDAGDACTVHATVRRVAEVLRATWADEHADEPPPAHDLLMAEAFTWLARPLELAALLLAHRDDAPDPDLPPEPAEPAEDGVSGPLALDPARAAALLDALRSGDLTVARPRAVLFLHLHEAALDGSAPCVARVEGLGPVPVDRLHELLRHHRVAVRPVLDLADRVATSAYEFPEHLKERLHLLHHGDAFPHASAAPAPDSPSLDHDHVVPFDPGGPPGQTSTDNGQPLTRTNHRAKTHRGWACAPRAPGEVLWRSPHGLLRLVDHRGTHRVPA